LNKPKDLYQNLLTFFANPTAKNGAIPSEWQKFLLNDKSRDPSVVRFIYFRL
jgi:hypothetical protein